MIKANALTLINGKPQAPDAVARGCQDIVIRFSDGTDAVPGAVEELTVCRVVRAFLEKLSQKQVCWKTTCRRKGGTEMITYSALNDPGNYSHITAELLNTRLPEIPAFAVRPEETIVHTFIPYWLMNTEELEAALDDTDRTVLEAVALSKYLTSLQIYEYITLRGCDVTRPRLRKRLLKLMRFRVIQEKELHSPSACRGMKYYQLNSLGYQYAMLRGVPFHMGNRYVSYTRRTQTGEIDTPCDVKRILVGNQIVLGLLKSGARMQRFGIMETLRPDDPELTDKGCMIRTAANVRLNADSILAYEVVRDLPKTYEKLADKVSRYYRLVHNEEYLRGNFHGDHAWPQLIICGESFEHNRKIAAFLKEQGLWKVEDPILFTEDLLNIRDSLSSIYGLNDDGSRSWYSLPGRQDPDVQSA